MLEEERVWEGEEGFECTRCGRRQPGRGRAGLRVGGKMGAMGMRSGALSRFKRVCGVTGSGFRDVEEKRAWMVVGRERSGRGGSR